MKRPITRTLLVIFLAITWESKVFGKDDLDQEMQGFEDKISHQKAATAPGDQQRVQYTQATTLSRVKMLRSALNRKEYDKARQLLGDNGLYEIPPEFQQQWLDLTDKISRAIDQKKSEALEDWRIKVDQLVADVHAICLKAKSSAELDPLFVRCAALQMERQGRENVLGARIEEKIQGIAFTLENWAHFLDCSAAGNKKAAMDSLKTLITNSNRFPVLSQGEIEQHVEADAMLENATVLSLAAKVFDGVKSPDDLGAAIQRIKDIAPKLSKSDMAAGFQREQQKLEILQRAWEAAKKGDPDGATRLLGDQSRVGGYSDFEPYENPVKQQINYRVFGQKLSSLSHLDFKPDEETGSMVSRALDALQAKADYPAMLDVMNLTEKLDRSEASSRDRKSIEKYLAGQKFESIDDFLPAITEYRGAISAATGHYAPVNQATEALQRLKEKHPEAFKDYQGALMEEVRALRQQISTMPSFPSGRPFPPGLPR